MERRENPEAQQLNFKEIGAEKRTNFHFALQKEGMKAQKTKGQLDLKQLHSHSELVDTTASKLTPQDFLYVFIGKGKSQPYSRTLIVHPVLQPSKLGKDCLCITDYEKYQQMLKYRADYQDEFNTAHRAATDAFLCWDESLAKQFAKANIGGKPRLVWVAGTDLVDDPYIKALAQQQAVAQMNGLPLGNSRASTNATFCYDWNALLAVYDAANIIEQEKRQNAENKRAAKSKTQPKQLGKIARDTLMKGKTAETFKLVQTRIRANFDEFFRTNVDMKFTVGINNDPDPNPLKDFGGPNGTLKTVRESFELIDESDTPQKSVAYLKGQRLTNAPRLIYKKMCGLE